MGKYMNRKLSVGWGEADITPENKTIELSGQYYKRIATGIHSRLKTIALVLEQDNAVTVMISLDVVGIPDDFSVRLQNSVAAAIPQIQPDKIIINAIHTHSAPGFNTIFPWWEPEPDSISGEEYRDFVEEKIIEAVKAAWSSRKISGVYNTLSFARVGHCRRAVYANGTAEMYGRTDRDDFTGMEGGEDSGVDLLFVFDENQQPTGAIVNVACPSQAMEATYQVSSDFMGALREKLKAHFGGEFKTLCQISAAGCQAPRDLARNYRGEPDFWHADGVEVISERLLNAVKAVYDNSKIDFAAELRHTSIQLELPRRRASYEDYTNAKAEMKRLENIMDSNAAYADFCSQTHANEQVDGPGPYDSKLHHFVKIRNNEAVVKRYEDQNEKPFYNMQLHVVKLGKIAFASNSFELYLDFGHRIKARSEAEQTLLIQLANGTGGYLPSKRAEELGGYGGLIINGQVGSDGGAMLADKTVEEIKKLWQ